MKWTILLACSLGLCPSATQLATAFVGLSVDPSAFQRNLQRTRTNTHDLSNERQRPHRPTTMGIPLGDPNRERIESASTASGRSPAKGLAEGVRAAITTAALGLALAGPMLSFPGDANAVTKRMVGDISASGLVFKDKLNVEAFSDPKVTGVTIYLSDFSRPVADKLLNGDIFSDPSSAGLFCVRSGPMEVSEGINASKEGEELFKEDRSFFKSIVVRRLYDKEANNVVYVSYSSKLDTNSDGNKSRFKSSLCALHVE